MGFLKKGKGFFFFLFSHRPPPPPPPPPNPLSNPSRQILNIKDHDDRKGEAEEAHGERDSDEGGRSHHQQRRRQGGYGRPNRPRKGRPREIRVPSLQSHGA